MVFVCPFLARCRKAPCFFCRIRSVAEHRSPKPEAAGFAPTALYGSVSYASASRKTGWRRFRRKSTSPLQRRSTASGKLYGGPVLFESTRPALRKVYKTENPVPGSDTGSLGGRGWIRTTEAEKQQIYSLSPLATREHAQILFTSLPDDLFILADKSGFVNRFFAFFQFLFSSAKKRRSLAEILRFGCAVC